MSKIIKFKKESKYTKLSNKTLQDESLSFGARGLLGYIMSLPDDWTLRMSDLYNRSPKGRKAIDNIASELKNSAHLIKINYKVKNGRFKGCDWVAFDEVESLNDVVDFLKNVKFDEDVIMLTLVYVETPISISFSPNVPLVTIGKPATGKGATTNKTRTNKTRTKETSSSIKEAEEDLFKNIKIKAITKTNIKKYIKRSGKDIDNKKLLSMYTALKNTNNFDDFDKAFYCHIKGEWEISESIKSFKQDLKSIYVDAKSIKKNQGKENALEFFRNTCKNLGFDYTRGTLGAKYLGDLKLG